MNDQDKKDKTDKKPEDVAKDLDQFEADELDDKGVENVTGGTFDEQTLFDNCNC